MDGALAGSRQTSERRSTAFLSSAYFQTQKVRSASAAIYDGVVGAHYGRLSSEVGGAVGTMGREIQAARARVESGVDNWFCKEPTLERCARRILGA